MRAIWRYPLDILPEQTFRAPYLANVLAVRMEDGRYPTLYMLVDPTSPDVDKVIVMRRPGEEVEEARDVYIGEIEIETGIYFFFERFQ